MYIYDSSLGSWHRAPKTLIKPFIPMRQLWMYPG